MERSFRFNLDVAMLRDILSARSSTRGQLFPPESAQPYLNAATSPTAKTGVSTDEEYKTIRNYGNRPEMLRKILGAIIVIFLVVMPHELGHFAASRLSGVPVERLSVGFGPTLGCVRPAVTEYCLSWLPLGGYVVPMDESVGRQYSSQELLQLAADSPEYFSALTSRSGWVSNKSPLIQFSIAAAGTTINFLFVIALVPILFRYAKSDDLSLEDFQMIERQSTGSFIGPIGLLKIAGRSGERGMAAILSLSARFSIAIGVLQLWPIPFFDGDHLADALIAAVRTGQYWLLVGMGAWVCLLRALYLVAQRKLLELRGVLVVREQGGGGSVKRFLQRLLLRPPE